MLFARKVQFNIADAGTEQLRNWMVGGGKQVPRCWSGRRLISKGEDNPCGNGLEMETRV